MTSKFKVGDRVALKTGSREMTIASKVFSNTAPGIITIVNKYECEWNFDNKKQKAVFIEDVLILLSPNL